MRMTSDCWLIDILHKKRFAWAMTCIEALVDRVLPYRVHRAVVVI